MLHYLRKEVEGSVHSCKYFFFNHEHHEDNFLIQHILALIGCVVREKSLLIILLPLPGHSVMTLLTSSLVRLIPPSVEMLSGASRRAK